MREIGLAVTAVEILRSGASTCRIELDRARSEREKWVRHRRMALTGLYCAMALIAMLLPFLLQALALHGVDQQIASLRPDVAKVEALRRQIANGTTGIDVMVAEQARVGDALAVLAAVTAALPDDTYLTSLSLQQGHLTMSGQSAAAAKLIGAISESGIIGNAAFDAPITRTDQSRADLFSIRADLAAAKTNAGSGSKP